MSKSDRAIKKEKKMQDTLNKFESLFPGFEQRYVPIESRCIHCINQILSDYEYCKNNKTPFRFSRHVENEYQNLLHCVRLTNSNNLLYSLQ